MHLKYCMSVLLLLGGQVILPAAPPEAKAIADQNQTVWELLSGYVAWYNDPEQTQIRAGSAQKYLKKNGRRPSLIETLPPWTEILVDVLYKRSFLYSPEEHRNLIKSRLPGIYGDVSGMVIAIEKIIAAHRQELLDLNLNVIPVDDICTRILPAISESGMLPGSLKIFEFTNKAFECELKAYIAKEKLKIETREKERLKVPSEERLARAEILSEQGQQWSVMKDLAAKELEAIRENRFVELFAESWQRWNQGFDRLIQEHQEEAKAIGRRVLSAREAESRDDLAREEAAARDGLVVDAQRSENVAEIMARNQQIMAREQEIMDRYKAAKADQELKVARKALAKTCFDGRAEICRKEAEARSLFIPFFFHRLGMLMLPIKERNGRLDVEAEQEAKHAALLDSFTSGKIQIERRFTVTGSDTSPRSDQPSVSPHSEVSSPVAPASPELIPSPKAPPAYSKFILYPTLPKLAKAPGDLGAQSSVVSSGPSLREERFGVSCNCPSCLLRIPSASVALSDDLYSALPKLAKASAHLGVQSPVAPACPELIPYSTLPKFNPHPKAPPAYSKR